MAKNRRTSLLIEDGIYEKLQDIMEREAISNIAEAIRYSVRHTHRDLFKGYVEVRRKALEQPPKITAKQKKEQEAKEVLERGKKICEELNGEVVEDAVGGTCRYETYLAEVDGSVTTFPQEKPLDMLNGEDIETQYEPSKADVTDIWQRQKEKSEQT